LRRASLHADEIAKAALAAEYEIMRTETERLIEEIKQSVGLLRRHL
jgi:hypothetical protein